MDHDVFISFSSKDEAAASRVCRDIEHFGISCWISSRDIGPGEDFQDSIISAMETARVVLLVFSANANQSREIKKELAIANDRNLPIIPARIEDVQPTQGIKYQLTTRQYIDLFKDWEGNMRRVVDAIMAQARGSPAVREPAVLLEPLPAQVPARDRSPESQPALSGQDLEKAGQDLTVEIGPIAQFLVRAAASEATSVADLYRRLSEHIPNGQRRAAFLKKVPRWR